MNEKNPPSRKNARLRFTLYGILMGVLFPVISSILFIAINRFPFTPESFLLAQVNNPLQWIIDTAPLFLGYFAYLAGTRQDRVERLNQTLAAQLVERDQLVTELQKTRTELEHTVSRQLVQLKTAAEVASEALTIRETEELLQHTVMLISERFGFYHTGIFLLDPGKEYAVLRAASSEGGKNMLARQHKLRVGEVGIVGYVAGQGQSRIALDVGEDAAFFNNPDLPQTRSEMALPLRVQDEIMGVLDVQSTEKLAFTEDDVKILQTLANQIALAIQNANLLSEAENALQELQKLYQVRDIRGWRGELEERSISYQYDLTGVKPLMATTAAIPDEAGIAAGPQADAHTMVLPIRLRGQKLGEFILQRENMEAPWSEYEMDIARETINQVALSLDNARLLQETRRRAEMERVASEMSSHLWATTDIHSILKTALGDLGRTLEASDAMIQLIIPETDGFQVQPTDEQLQSNSGNGRYHNEESV